ncbi:hypothetical protein AHAS_Ahas19G0080700 [Arachis hypogaea]
MKLNVDGSVLQPDNRGTCCGIIRDWNGHTFAGFSMNIGACTITLAELWASMLGLNLSPSLASQRSIQELLVKLERVEVRHIFREVNFCADYLAKAGQGHLQGVNFFENPSLVVSSRLR